MSRLSEYNEADRTIIDPAAVLREKMRRSILREKKKRALAAWDEAVRSYRDYIAAGGRGDCDSAECILWLMMAYKLGWYKIEGPARVSRGR